METDAIIRVTLRLPCEADIATYAARPPSAEIHRMYGGGDAPAPRGMDNARGWFTWLCDHPFARIIEADGQAVGEIRLHSLSDHDRSARLAVGLFAEQWLGRGIGRQAIRQTLDQAFGPMALHRVDLKVLAFNIRAIRCYRACGFSLDGTLREAVRIAGAWHDECIMSILTHEHDPQLTETPRQGAQD